MSSSFPQQSRRHFPKHLSAYLCFEKVARLRPRAYFIRRTHKIFLNDKRTPLFSRTCGHVFYYCIFIMLLRFCVCEGLWRSGCVGGGLNCEFRSRVLRSWGFVYGVRFGLMLFIIVLMYVVIVVIEIMLWWDKVFLMLMENLRFFRLLNHS